MTPRYVPNDRPITREQALLAVEAAGLDTSRPLDEQFGEPGDSDVAQRLDALDAKLDALAGGQGTPAPEQTFAQGLAAKLNEAQSDWFTTGGDDAA